MRHPVMLRREVWPGVAAVAGGDIGARRWLKTHPDLVTCVPCDDAGAPDDIDTPADLAALLLRVDEPPSNTGRAAALGQ